MPYVVSAAAKALGRRGDKAAVDPLIRALAALEKKKDVTWLDVRAALTAICGFDYETAKEWEGFWLARRDTFDPARDRGERTESETTVRDETRFFTEVIVSKRIMFVIDVSGSMRERDIPVPEGEEDGNGGTDLRPKPGTTSTKKTARIEVVQKALIACVKDLKPDVKFNILAFSSGNKAWRPSKQGLQPASEGNKQDAIRWIAALEADGATETDRSARSASTRRSASTSSSGSPRRTGGSSRRCEREAPGAASGCAPRGSASRRGGAIRAGPASRARARRVSPSLRAARRAQRSRPARPRTRARRRARSGASSAGSRSSA